MADERRAPVAPPEILKTFFALSMMYSLASALIDGFYPVFLRAHGLTQFEANSILASSFTIVFLTDVPTGAFADVAGRRLSFAAGNAIRSIGWGIYFFASRFSTFMMAECASAIGYTLGNGALQAWAVDSLDAAGVAGDKTVIFSRITQAAGLSEMIGAILGSYAATFDLALPWAIGALLLMLTGVAGAFWMKSAPIVEGGARVGLARTIASRLSAGIALSIAKKTILFLGIAVLVQACAFAPVTMEWQEYFIKSWGVQVGAIGLLFCLFRVGAIVGAGVTARLRPSPILRPYLIVSAVGLSGLSLLATGVLLDRPILVLIMMVSANVCAGMAYPLVQTWANEEISAEYRATLLSFLSTFATAGGALGLLAGGWLADAYGIRLAWEMSGALALTAVPLFLSAGAISRRNTAGSGPQVGAAIEI